MRDELKEGDQILVKVINIDPTGKIRLSRKALLQDEGAEARREAGAGRERVATSGARPCRTRRASVDSRVQADLDGRPFPSQAL